MRRNRDCQIRVAQPADFEAVSSVLLACYSKLLPERYGRDLLDAALPLLCRAQPTLLASRTYYVAENDAGELVGCGGWSKERPGDGFAAAGEGYIRHFATHPEWLGQGVGRALLARCFADARPHIGTLHCFSTLNAEPFYRACGFETVGPMDVAIGPVPKFPAILMKCALARTDLRHCDSV